MARHLELTLTCAPLGDAFLVTSASVHEALSEPTTATVALIADDDVDGAAAIGKDAVLELSVDGKVARRFHLVVVGFRYEGPHRGDKRRYRIDLAHELHLLTLRAGVRIFQEKDAKEIVEAVIADAGLAADHFSYSLQRTPGKRTYCVQYRETDFAFVSRLFEHEGIFYFIQDDDSKATVTFADKQDAFDPIDGDVAMQLLDTDMHGAGVHDLVFEAHATPQQHTVSDYNQEAPKLDLKASASVPFGAGGDWFEYPTGHQVPAAGQTLADLRAEEASSGMMIATGRTDRPAFRSGAYFELEGPSREELAMKYLIRSVDHEIHVISQEDRDVASSYENRFTAMPFETQYRPPRRAPRARVRGVHSVITTGPSGGEIHTDKQGRMKGKFFWDRLGAEDDTATLWMRLLQFPISGSMALARVGWEMGAVYFDGDPDRPIVVSRLYTAEKTPPYAQPGAKARSSFQTASSPGGGKSNEVRMDDSAGSQEFFVNASKDYASQANNNKTEKVGVDESVQVGTDSAITVGVDETISIGASQKVTVSSDSDLTVKTDRTKSVGGSETVTVSGDITTVVEGSDTETTGGSHTTLAALGVERTMVGSNTLTVGGSMINVAATGVSFAVVGARSETIGAVKLSVSAATVGESVIGALANTVGGAIVHAAAANRMGGTKGPAAITVGGVVLANAAGKLSLKAKKISIKVLGVANLLGGGGVLTLTPGSASFVGIVGLDASGGVKISGNPNLVG